jgi:hypothetical protein
MSKRTQLACVKGLLGLAFAGLATVTGAPASAMTTSDDPAAVLMYPKVVVDTSGLWGPPTDTLLTITNNAVVEEHLKQAHCYYINATGFCANNEDESCRTSADCTTAVPCVPNWAATDFNIYITPNQALAWYASEGLGRGDFPIEGPGFCTHKITGQIGNQCFGPFGCGADPNVECVIGPDGLNNLGSGIPPVNDDPFIGSLICIQFDPNQNPPVPDRTETTNQLSGDASIIALDTNTAKAVDVAKYNAVGIRALPGGDSNGVLLIGGTSAEYEGCANVLIMDHFFDNATDPMTVGLGTNSQNGTFTTELTLIPCGNNFANIEPGRVVAQMLVFNEFEQRFSTSAVVDCLYNKRISNIDTPNSNRSIFSAGVSGTLAGQTRIQGAGNAATGNGLTGVVQLFVATSLTGEDPRCLGEGLCSSAAYSLDGTGSIMGGDTLTIP